MALTNVYVLGLPIEAQINAATEDGSVLVAVTFEATLDGQKTQVTQSNEFSQFDPPDSYLDALSDLFLDANPPVGSP